MALLHNLLTLSNHQTNFILLYLFANVVMLMMRLSVFSDHTKQNKEKKIIHDNIKKRREERLKSSVMHNEARYIKQ
jgi:hypothetical protein